MKKKTMTLLLCAMMSAAVFAQDEKKEFDGTPKIGGTIRSKYEYQTEEGEGRFEVRTTTPDGPIARFIEKANGGKNGFQHVALRVDDIEACLADLQAKEVPLIDKKYRIGAGGCHIAFLHPKATGLLLELTERPGGPSFKA